MGTKFYLMEQNELANLAGNPFRKSKLLIGKRSSAGKYCWDCKKSLCKERNIKIRSGDSSWNDQCPTCGNSFQKENDSSKDERNNLNEKKGLSIATSFTFMMNSSSFQEMIDNILDENVKIIEDEYNYQYSKKEFLDEVAKCPEEFVHYEAN